MPRIKTHLENVYRTGPAVKSRMKYLRLDMNENVTGLPADFVKKVLSKIDPAFLATYPEYDILREKIAKHDNLKLENICLSNGSDAAINYIFDAYISPGDRVLFTEPTFAMYAVYCNIFNAKTIALEYKSDLSFPKEEFIQRISPDIKIAIIANPNNPTGSVINQKDLIKIIEKAKDNNVLLIVDEAYFYFYPETVISEVKNYDNLIVLRTFSKLCGLAALRLGYAAASPRIIENLGKVKSTFDVNSLALLFANELLDKPDIIQNLINSINEGKEYLMQKLSKKGIGYKKSYANFVLIKCQDNVDEIMKRLLEENILVSGGFKQDFLKRYVRVTVGSKKDMQKFWQSFLKIYE